MDPIAITALIGVLTLLVERGFAFASKIKKSKCCGSEVDFDSNSTPAPTPK